MTSTIRLMIANPSSTPRHAAIAHRTRRRRKSSRRSRRETPSSKPSNSGPEDGEATLLENGTKALFLTLPRRPVSKQKRTVIPASRVVKRRPGGKRRARVDQRRPSNFRPNQFLRQRRLKAVITDLV